MAIFPYLSLEPVVQINDRTRLNAEGSFGSGGDVLALWIRPSDDEDYVDVTDDKYLDWQYGASGTYEVSAIASGVSGSAEFTQNIQIVTAAQDNLFSNDADLKLHEPDIMKWTEDGRNSFLNIHRRAKKVFLEYLRTEGYTDIFGAPYTDAAVIDIEEVKQWVTYAALRIIFEGISNSTDDVFHVKAKRYAEMEIKKRNAALLRIDTDGDGELLTDEGIDTRSGFVARR